MRADRVTVALMMIDHVKETRLRLMCSGSEIYVIRSSDRSCVSCVQDQK